MGGRYAPALGCTRMWLSDVDKPAGAAEVKVSGIVDPAAVIEPGVILNEDRGPIDVGARTRICAGAVITGPVRIGADCVVGPSVVIRGPCVIGDDVHIGHSSEISRTPIAAGTRIGPRCSLRNRQARP